MSGSRPVVPDEDPIAGVQYTELRREAATVGVLYDPGNSDAWLQSTVTVTVEN